jgi:hypothetical protein
VLPARFAYGGALGAAIEACYVRIGSNFMDGVRVEVIRLREMRQRWLRLLLDMPLNPPEWESVAERAWLKHQRLRRHEIFSVTWNDALPGGLGIQVTRRRHHHHR